MESNYKILCVDDEESILKSLKRLTRKEDYKLITCTSGKDALEIMNDEKVQIVISDYRMPEMTGTEFLHEVKKRYEETIRIVLSGYAEAHSIMDAINKGEIYRFICKPWNDEELLMTIRQCIEQYELRQNNLKLVSQIKEQNSELQQAKEKLREKVSAYDESLNLVEKMILKDKTPILCVNKSGHVVLRNPVITTITELANIKLGEHISNVLDKNLSDIIQKCLDTESNSFLCNINFKDKELSLFNEPIYDKNQLSGCIVFVENTNK